MARNAAAYEADLHAWTQEQARLLREGRTGEVDAENLAEEIDSLGRKDRRELRSRVTVLLAHLLKWEHQAASRNSTWKGTIREQRRQIAQLLAESPSLRAMAEAALSSVYADAREDAADDTGRDPGAFPGACPYSLADALDRGFWPGAPPNGEAGR
jgi:ribosomal protein L29